MLSWFKRTFVRNVKRQTNSQLSKDLENIEVRRAFFLADMNIVRVSALSLVEFSGFNANVPVPALPFHDLPFDDPVVASIAQLQASTSVLNFDMDEALFSGAYWAPLLRVLFPYSNPLCILQPEAKLKSVNSSYPDLKIDFAVHINTGRSDDGCPILWAELSKEPFYDQTSIHKDEEKLACMMACSLLKLIGMFKTRSKVELESLIVYGLLMSAFEFEVCTLNAVFEEGDLESFFFVFTTSRDQWRFKIRTLEADQKRAPIAKNFVCSGSGLQWRTINPSEGGPISPSSTDEATTESLQGSSHIPVYWRGRFELYSEKPLSTEVAERLQLINREGRADLVGAAVMVRVKELVLEQVALIRGFVGTGSFPPSDPDYRYPESKSKQMDAGRRSSHSLTPLLKSSKYQSLKLDQIKVKKKVGVHELEIYSLASIISSNYFPKLSSAQLLEDDSGLTLLVLERIFPLISFEGSVHSVLCAFPHLIEALSVLHSSGFVHGDISPGNVGFNAVVGKWQLFDFDQSRPIADAAVNPKGGGTRGFCSRQYEETGLYAPSDDFISMKLALFWWLERELFEDWPSYHQALRDLEKAIDSCEPVEKLKLEAEKVIAQFNEQL